MIGPLLLTVSWLLLRLEGRALAALGFDKPVERARQFALGLSLAAGDPFVLNATVGPGALLNSLRFTVNSVLYEELAFRGYLLYQAIRILGPRRAVLLAAAAFGVYHWFSYGIIGNPVVMAYVFLLTGARQSRVASRRGGAGNVRQTTARTDVPTATPTEICQARP